MTYWSGIKRHRQGAEQPSNTRASAFGRQALLGENLQRLTPECAGGIHAALDYLAGRMGIASPAVYLAHPPCLPSWAGASAARLNGQPAIWLSPASASWPPHVLAAVLAHELGHIAAGHCKSPLAFLVRHGGRLAFVGGLVLGDVGLIALTGLSLVLAELANRRYLRRVEQEADELAAAGFSSVAPLLAMYAWAGPVVPWCVHAQQLLNGYPRRRPWLDAMAGRELRALHLAVRHAAAMRDDASDGPFPAPR